MSKLKQFAKKNPSPEAGACAWISNVEKARIPSQGREAANGDLL